MKTFIRMATFAAAAVLAGCGAAGDAAGRLITFESLLNEMVDRDATARLPEPPYACRQFSSYDRRSKTPDDPKGWFANADRGHFLRTENSGGRTEWVVMDHIGQGCVTRIWTPNDNKPRVVRFYLDGADTPAIEANWLDLVNGRALAGPPMAYTSARAGNMYLPIPYAKRCKITLDRKPFYYQINYRAYEAGTKVKSFTMSGFRAAARTRRRVGRMLLKPATFAKGKTVTISRTIEPGGKAAAALPGGPAAVRSVKVRLQGHDLDQALRSTVLQMTFDDEPTVWCPVGDFFGSGVGLNAYEGWYRTIEKDGPATCRWVMPYAKSGRITLINLGAKGVKVDLKAAVGAWTWDDRSMHFHANWRQQYPIDTRPQRDWNYIQIKGRGVYVGDALAVMNPVPNWWGEGDEKIWVDGETFPSHFGTGTEDYYGYAWGNPKLYAKPFHAQVRCGHRTFGHSTETRTRSLDAIPFGRSLKIDMEVWHSRHCKVAYAATTYWYARGGATSNRRAAPREAARPVPQPKAR